MSPPLVNFLAGERITVCGYHSKITAPLYPVNNCGLITFHAYSFTSSHTCLMLFFGPCTKSLLRYWENPSTHSFIFINHILKISSMWHSGCQQWIHFSHIPHFHLSKSSSVHWLHDSLHLTHAKMIESPSSQYIYQWHVWGYFGVCELSQIQSSADTADAVVNTSMISLYPPYTRRLWQGL